MESFLIGSGGTGTLRGDISNHTSMISGSFWVYLKRAGTEDPNDYPSKDGSQIGKMYPIGTTQPPYILNLNREFESRCWIALC